MITFKIWKIIYYSFWTEPIIYLWGILGSIITIPLDILLSPIEIIAYTVYKIIEEE